MGCRFASTAFFCAHAVNPFAYAALARVWGLYGLCPNGIWAMLEWRYDVIGEDGLKNVKNRCWGYNWGYKVGLHFPKSGVTHLGF